MYSFHRYDNANSVIDAIKRVSSTAVVPPVDETLLIASTGGTTAVGWFLKISTFFECS